ncbi:MAG: glycosyltransferase family 87 protein [Candidatus Limnocylindrales bacterium]
MTGRRPGLAGGGLRSDLAGPGGWLLVALLAAEILVVTRSTDVPNGSGVPYWEVWLVGGAATLAVASLVAARLRPFAPRLRPVEALVILAVVAMALSDVTMAWQPLRDLGIYVRAGEHFRDGSAVYVQTPLTAQPIDRTSYPFLYPPFTLPLFGALSLLPVPAPQAVWLGCSLALGLVALRLIGLPRRWLMPALLWPPLFQGLWVGNVAVPALALYAVGPWLGAGLILGAAFKSYTGLTALWLVSERRWRQIVAGIGALLLLVAATVPLTGTGLWSDWLSALGVFQASQKAVPGLYGFGLPRFVPLAVYVALAAAAVIAALLARGRECLARLGSATVVASPSLFGHGLLMAVPSLLSLRSPWLWLAVGFLSTPDGPQWWLAVAVVAASWAAPAMRRAEAGASAGAVTREGLARDPLHPLGTAARPWPSFRPAP